MEVSYAILPRTTPNSLCIDDNPYLIDLNPHILPGECLAHYIPEGETFLGSTDSPSRLPSGEQVTIQLSDGFNLSNPHCILDRRGEKIELIPVNGSINFLNGTLMTTTRTLTHGDRVIIGSSHGFTFYDPKVARERREQHKAKGMDAVPRVHDWAYLSEEFATRMKMIPTQGDLQLELEEANESVRHLQSQLADCQSTQYSAELRFLTDIRIKLFSIQFQLMNYRDLIQTSDAFRLKGDAAQQHHWERRSALANDWIMSCPSIGCVEVVDHMEALVYEMHTIGSEFVAMMGLDGRDVPPNGEHGGSATPPLSPPPALIPEILPPNPPDSFVVKSEDYCTRHFDEHLASVGPADVLKPSRSEFAATEPGEREHNRFQPNSLFQTVPLNIPTNNGSLTEEHQPEQLDHKHSTKEPLTTTSIAPMMHIMKAALGLNSSIAAVRPRNFLMTPRSASIGSGLDKIQSLIKERGPFDVSRRGFHACVRVLAEAFPVLLPAEGQLLLPDVPVDRFSEMTLLQKGQLSRALKETVVGYLAMENGDKERFVQEINLVNFTTLVRFARWKNEGAEKILVNRAHAPHAPSSFITPRQKSPVRTAREAVGRKSISQLTRSPSSPALVRSTTTRESLEIRPAALLSARERSNTPRHAVLSPRHVRETRSSLVAIKVDPTKPRPKTASALQPTRTVVRVL